MARVEYGRDINENAAVAPLKRNRVFQVDFSTFP